MSLAKAGRSGRVDVGVYWTLNRSDLASIGYPIVASVLCSSSPNPPRPTLSELEGSMGPAVPETAPQATHLNFFPLPLPSGSSFCTPLITLPRWSLHNLHPQGAS
jgi:hypothetical protein